jgi:hypothetical protein
MRIVSLLPSATEIVADLGLAGDLVGRSHECQWPEEVREVAVVSASRIDPAAWDSRQIDEAVRAARRALALCPKEPWAQHALAHVMLTQGRLREGRQFMQHVSPTWTGLNSFMLTHNWWHLALFELELGDGAAALQLYDSRVWGVVKEYSQDQIGAVSLLARLELAGVDIGTRWQDVADHLTTRVHDHVLPFLDLQYLYGLARAGRPEASTLLGSIEAHCLGIAPARSSAPDATVIDDVWLKVCLPASRGLAAHAQTHNYETATLSALVITHNNTHSHTYTRTTHAHTHKRARTRPLCRPLGFSSFAYAFEWVDLYAYLLPALECLLPLPFPSGFNSSSAVRLWAKSPPACAIGKRVFVPPASVTVPPLIVM